jgi:signal transduction histidine kinase
MFRSIRWRLVISYVLVTLLTVSAVGVLTLSLVKRYVEQRVVEDLTANADSVARQAEPLMWPMKQPAALDELARTVAFLGDVRVQIFDNRRRLLADSGSPDGVNQLVWLTPPEQSGLEHLDSSWIVLMPRGARSGMAFPQDSGFLGQLPNDFELTIISRMGGVWGNRFTFEGALADENQYPYVGSDTDFEALHATLDDAEAPRSEQAITAPIGAVDDPLGYVELSGGPAFGAEALATTRRAFLLAAGGAMVLAVIVGLLVSHGLTAPLRSLTTTASRMSDDLSTRAPVRGRDEIGQLAQQLNQMAERLEASFAALTADRDALRRFVADASHELRTPITALRNFNELLQDAVADDPAAREEFLVASAVQVERLEWITKNLLDLSRLDAGLVALDLDSHGAGELIEEVAAAFKRTAEEREITLSINPPGSPVSLYCDRARTALALSNLLNNALKFTPNSGHVEIGARGYSVASFKGTEEGKGVRFWVQDDGPGIDPADQPHIFERFYRGQGQRADGSGLGLAIVQSVVQAHGGNVWVESESQSGSRFVIELPDNEGS